MKEPAHVAPTLQDEALVVAIAGGDSGALAALYDRYCPTLLAIAARILGARGDAEDLVHDVFLEVWKHAGDFQLGRGTVRTWLLVRLRSRAIDRQRAASSSRAESLDAHPEEWFAATELPDELGPDRSAVRRALEALPAEQREVIFLGYFEDLSSTEMSARLSVPVGTVKSRVAAARRRLETILSEPAGYRS